MAGLTASQQTLRQMGGKLIALGLATSLGRSLGLLLPLARLAHEASATLSALTSEDVTVRRVAWSAALLSCSGGKCAAIYALTHMVGLYSSLAMSCALSGALLLGASFATKWSLLLCFCRCRSCHHRCAQCRVQAIQSLLVTTRHTAP